MPDWSSSMQQTFEYYTVDPATWGNIRMLQRVKSSSIDWDETNETLGSMSLECDDEIGESYVRVYLVTIQNGLKEKFPLGTFLVQTPSTSFDGKSHGSSLDAYTPLLELKDKYMPIGYTIRKGENVLDVATDLCRENIRAPVSAVGSNETLNFDFVADPDESMLSYLTSLISNAKYKLSLDEMGRVLFAPEQDIKSLQPVWTFDDGNSSILYPEIDLERDLYGVPNVVEVVYSNDNTFFYSKIVNDDPNSPISTVSRGREVMHRETNPSFSGNPNQQQIDKYAEQLLRNLSCLEYTLKYTHGYCPVRVGDCVRLDYVRAGIKNVKAKVTNQSIKCEPGCPVTETAVFSTHLWG